MTTNLEQLRYPIGPWRPQDEYSAETIRHIAERIRQLPQEYEATVSTLSASELSKQYRPGSWTVQQLVHHVADTHLMHFLRLKHALTEPNTTGIMGDVNAWAALEEAKTALVPDSLLMLTGLHRRIAHLAETLTSSDLAITYFHPVRQRHLTLADALSIIVWHGEHHLGHIRLALGLPVTG